MIVSYMQDIKEAAQTDPYFDRMNAQDISVYHNIDVDIVRADIRAYRKNQKETV